MSGLHSPVVVDPQAANFEDVRLTIYCFPGEFVNPVEASTLCQKVGTLFENQGAQVRTSTRKGTDSLEGGLGDDELDEDAALAEAPTDLILELRGRQVHKADNPLTWGLSILTFSLVPAVTESTFAQDIVVRDGSGFLLASDTLQGRLIQRYGAGAWAGTALLNLGREDVDKIEKDTANIDLSNDLYTQLSQITFNAKMQWQVLQEGDSWE